MNTKAIRRVISLISVIVLVFSFTACSSSTDISSDDNESNVTEPTTTPEESEDIDDDSSSKAVEEEPSMSYEITDTRTKTWVNSIGTTWLQTIVEITNTGSSNLYLSSGSYDLEDSSGNLITSRTMVSTYPNVLAPGEKGYMYEETTLDEAVDGEVIALPREDVGKANVDLIRFPVTDIKISAGDYGGVKMIGRVENTGEEDESLVYVVAFLYDSDGVCIGQMFTILMDTLEVGDKIGFEMSGMSLPDDVTPESITDYVVYSYPTQIQF